MFEIAEDQFVYKISNKNDTKKLSKFIAKLSSEGDIILLKGDLGVGKTFFAQNFINYFYSEKIIVGSPTFNLVQTYKTNSFTIWHFDLYRLRSKDEIYNVGIEEALDNGIVLIEWPEIIIDMLPKNRLEINLNLSLGNREAILNPSYDWKVKIINNLN